MAAPVRVSVLNDFEIVVHGLAAMLEPFSGRIEIVDVGAGEPADPEADVVLYDTFAQIGSGGFEHALERRTTPDQKVVVYTVTLVAEAIEDAFRRGIDGYLPKSLPAERLVDALVRIHAGERVFADATDPGEADPVANGDWPGRRHGLSEREAEILVLICDGLNNEQIADRAYLSINTVKSYIRSAYAKIEVTSRSQAVLWSVDHGLRRPRS